MTGSVQPFCNGAGCGQKLRCCRYKAIIDVKHEQHFPFSPNRKENECGFFVGGNDKTFLENLKSMKDGRTENNSLRED